MGYCGWCGRPETLCTGGCRRALDPPRYCTVCGQRLTVQVTPTSWVGRCRAHGEVEG